MDDIDVYKYRQPRHYRIDRAYRYEGSLAILHETFPYANTEAGGWSAMSHEGSSHTRALDGIHLLH